MRHSIDSLNVWTLSYLLGLAAGLACSVWQWRASHRGLDGLGAFILYLLFCMPLTGLASGVFLFATGRQNGWPWTLPAGLMTLAVGVQAGWILWDADSRGAYVFMPLVLAAVSAAELARRGSPLPAAGWVKSSGPMLALIGIAAAGGVHARNSWVRHQAWEVERQAREEYERKDASMRGIERAAWLLGLEFTAPEGYKEAEFVRTGVFRDDRWGWLYRWDQQGQRLIVRRGLFGELSIYRPKLLPVAGKALESSALRTGVRVDLDSAVLDCSPPLDCALTWTVDTDGVKGTDRGVRGKLDEWVDIVEAAAAQALGR
jgi:hypothetical protein